MVKDAQPDTKPVKDITLKQIPPLFVPNIPGGTFIQNPTLGKVKTERSKEQKSLMDDKKLNNLISLLQSFEFTKLPETIKQYFKELFTYAQQLESVVKGKDEEITRLMFLNRYHFKIQEKKDQMYTKLVEQNRALAETHKSSIRGLNPLLAHPPAQSKVKSFSNQANQNEVKEGQTEMETDRKESKQEGVQGDPRTKEDKTMEDSARQVSFEKRIASNNSFRVGALKSTKFSNSARGMPIKAELRESKIGQKKELKSSNAIPSSVAS